MKRTTISRVLPKQALLPAVLEFSAIHPLPLGLLEKRYDVCDNALILVMGFGSRYAREKLSPTILVASDL
jgi:hypothetical protein